jgi:hypothetical protein
MFFFDKISRFIVIFSMSIKTKLFALFSLFAIAFTIVPASALPTLNKCEKFSRPSIYLPHEWKCPQDPFVVENYSNPASPFYRGFVGECRFYPGTLRKPAPCLIAFTTPAPHPTTSSRQLRLIHIACNSNVENCVGKL